MKSKTEIGRLGEDLALKELSAKGFSFVDRNFHSRFGEIDLVMLDKDVLVFIEVKLRGSEKFLELSETISPQKLKRLRKTAEIYLEGMTHLQIRFEETRFDAVLIKQIGSGFEITHLKDVLT